MIRLFLVTAALLGTLSCSGSSPAGECYDDGDCDGIARCTEEKTCREVQCIDSTQCPVGTHCLYDTCFTGCAESQDCSPGFVCNVDAAQCEPEACEDPDIDCWPGEVCGTETNECEVLDGLCQSCATIGYDTCRDVHGGECRYDTSGYVCFPGCDPSEEESEDRPHLQPRGFTCQQGTTAMIWYGQCSELQATETDTGTP